jgi:hypothetical protein
VCRVGAERVEHRCLGIYAHSRWLRGHSITVEDVSKKRRFNEEVSGQRRAEDQGPSVKRPSF